MMPHSRIESRVSGLAVEVEECGAEGVWGRDLFRLGRRIFMMFTKGIAYPSICEGTK